MMKLSCKHCGEEFLGRLMKDGVPVLGLSDSDRMHVQFSEATVHFQASHPEVHREIVTVSLVAPTAALYRHVQTDDVKVLKGFEEARAALLQGIGMEEKAA